MIIEASEREFYMRAEGHDIATLPDVPIWALPIVKTSLRAFALASSPNWVLRVRHNQFKTYRKRPKFMIQAASGSKNLAIMFRLPARPIYRDFSDVYNDLEANIAGVEVDYARMAAIGAKTAEHDELDLLVEMNQRRADRLRSKPPIRTMRSHNQWASTEHEMNQAMARIERAGGR